MNIFRFISIFIFLLLPAFLIAEEYTIKKGDTLWDISEEKMKDPFQWKKIWKANPHIKNPHLIFPDQKLDIPGELTEKEEIKEDTAVASKKAEVIQPVKIAPKKIPIRQGEYLISREVLLQSGFIIDTVTTAGKITGSPKKETIMGRNDYVYIQTDKPANIGDKFYIVTSSKKIDHPVTEKLVGYLVRIKGVLEIQEEDSGNKKALIIEAYEEIMTGDKIAYFYPIDPPLKPEKERRPAVNGTILGLWNDFNISGSGDIIYLDKGSKDGIEMGDVFTVISGEKPHISIGTARIISIKDKTSVALLKKAAVEIKTGDLFRN